MACVTAIWREQEAKKAQKERKKKTPWPAEPPKHGSGPPPYGYIHLVSKNVASLSKFPLRNPPLNKMLLFQKAAVLYSQ